MGAGLGVRSPDVGRAEGNYAAKVMAAVAAMRRKTGMTQQEFADALSEELGRQIRANKVTQWERGRYMPYSDVLLAGMAVSGAEPGDLAINPLASRAIQLVKLRRQVHRLEMERLGRPRRLPTRLELEVAAGDAVDYLTMQDAASELGVSRGQMYDYMSRGLKAWRLGTRTVFSRSDVVNWRKRRRGEKT